MRRAPGSVMPAPGALLFCADYALSTSSATIAAKLFPVSDFMRSSFARVAVVTDSRIGAAASSAASSGSPKS